MYSLAQCSHFCTIQRFVWFSQIDAASALAVILSIKNPVASVSGIRLPPSSAKPLIMDVRDRRQSICVTVRVMQVTSTLGPLVSSNMRSTGVQECRDARIGSDQSNGMDVSFAKQYAPTI